MSSMTKNALREIRQSLGRYLAIFAIIALGSGLFIGLRLSRPDFLETYQRYTDNTNFYNFRLVSTLGLTGDDVTEAKKLEGVTDAEGAVTSDFLYSGEKGDNIIITANSITDRINKIDLIAGRMPEKADECLADPNMYGEDDIGKTITLSEDNTQDTLDSFAYREYTIVGLTESVLYINLERGSSVLGNGSVAGYVYLLPEGFALDCYTDIYLTADTEGYVYTDEYEESASQYVKPLEDFMEERAVLRHDSIIDEATAKLEDAKKQYEDGLAEYQSGKYEYEKGWAEYQKKKAETEAQLADACAKLTEVSMEELEEKEQELLSAQKQIQSGYAEYESGLLQFNLQSKPLYAVSDAEISTYSRAVESFQSELGDLNARLNEINAELETAGAFRAAALRTERVTVQSRIAVCESALRSNSEWLQESLDYRAELDARFEPYEKQLSEGKAELDANSAQVEDGLKQIADAKKQLSEGLKEYEEGKKEAEKGFSEAESKFYAARIELDKAAQELEDAKRQLDDAETKIKNIEHADTYVLGRSTNIGYVCFESDTQVVDSVAGAFPVFFILVAALVCLTTMTRMVSDERTQIGIMKALGYGSGAIAAKYLFYSGSATILGCIFGICAGSFAFPAIVWLGYSIIYSFAGLVFTMDWGLAALISSVGLVSMLLVTWYACRIELKSVAAELIRPKAPEGGKRILLERVKWLWSRLSFMQKVSVRNILRYRMRIFMMLLGIGGCTALVLTALGLGNTINNVVDSQYGEISLYDYELSLAYDMNADEQKLLTDACGDRIGSAIFLYRGTADIKTADGIKSVTLTACDGNGLSGFIDLHSGDEPVACPDTDEVIINSNIAMLMGLDVGDEIEIVTADMDTLKLKISGIFDNYVMNHAFISLSTYEKQLGRAAEIKSALVSAPKGVDVRKNASELAKADAVRSISLCTDTGKMIANMMKSLNIVVFLIILCAGLLAFVVLYNLTNINISERIREIATLKVLGFYPNEAAGYVFRENLVLTGAGALFGLLLGVWLHSFVMHQIKVDMLYFKPSIDPLSYILSIVMTFVFAVIVNAIMRRRIDGIDMAGALKSIE